MLGHYFIQIDIYFVRNHFKKKGAKKSFDLFDYLATPSYKKAKIY